MADVTILLFKCLNPECAKPIKLKRPAKSGVYPVTCPHCGLKKNLKLKGLEEIDTNATEPLPGTQKSTEQTADIPDNSAKESILLNEDFLTGHSYSFPCPHCQSKEIAFNSSKAGRKDITCPLCKGPISFDVRDKTKVLVCNSETVQPRRGKLVHLRKGWLNKSYPLSEGRNTVGRYDEELNSDIAIKNDNNMSRRSVAIDVLRSPMGYEFKLTVLKSTNPVLHNGHQIADGESVSIEFGDSIVMGKTTLRFEPI